MQVIDLSVLEQTAACWVWPSVLGREPNQYVEFRHELHIEQDCSEAFLLVSADTNYAAWINGTFVDCGQYHDYPDAKTCDVLPVGSLLRQGNNVLSFVAYYQGEGSFQYISGRPGLLYLLNADGAVVASGIDTRFRPSRRTGTTARQRVGVCTGS